MKRISDNLEKAINLQISREEISSRIYLTMSLFLDNMGLEQGAKLWKAYSDEELTHAERLRQYLLDRGTIPEVPMLPAQKLELGCVTDVIAQSYAHEIQVSKWISELSLQALAEKDLSAWNMLQWFIDEQIQEEAKSLVWVDKVKILQKTNSPLYMLEHDFKKALKRMK